MRYQNALTPANASLFAACDGLFTNYWWGGKELACSASLAGNPNPNPSPSPSPSPNPNTLPLAGQALLARRAARVASGEADACREHTYHRVIAAERLRRSLAALPAEGSP